MRFILTLILAVAAGYGLLQIDQLFPDNYVKMYLGNYVVELKLIPLLLLILLAAAALFFVLWLLSTVLRLPKRFSLWRHNRARDKADEKLGEGYLSLIKGDWSRAESQLTTKQDHSHIPYVNYLAAAQAAQEQGKFDQRDAYLSAAYEAAPKERLAIGLTKAKLHQNAGQLDEALATLNDIQPEGGKNAQYTAMLVQVNQELGNWQQIQGLLGTATKQKALPKDTLNELENQAFLQRLRSADDKISAYKQLPRAQRAKVDNVAVYAQALVEQGDATTAEKVIRNTLGKDWSETLVDIYGKLETAAPAKLLRRVQGWLMARPENAHLHLAAGRLAMEAKQNDQAEEHLQQAIKLEQLPKAYSLLGELYETDNEAAKALQMYRVGMQAIARNNDVTEHLLDKPESEPEQELIPASPNK